MELKITGKVIELLKEQSGEGKNGTWRKRDFILETKGQYPRKVCITQWGDNIDQHNVNVDDEITVYIDIQSREYIGNWYTDVKAWKVELAENDMKAPPSAPGLTMDGNQEVDMPDLDDDLPF